MVLVGVKLFAWLTSGSVAVFASLLDSLMDTAASLINLFAVDYSLKPADLDHRFGHGKAEALAGLGQATFIAGSAVFLLYQAVEQLVEPRAVANVADAIWVLGFAMVLTVGLVAFQRYVVRQTGSTAVQADSLHYLTDLATNTATLVALMLIERGWLRADGLFGIAIGLYILYSAGRVGWTAVRILMDEELPQNERQAIVACVEGTEGVVGVQRLRSWRSGQRRVVDIDVLFDGERLLSDIHGNSDLVVRRLEQTFPEVDVSIRARPADSA
jgi:ferrous-iron efflux pump FieF